jgi:hypothetical protein
MSKIFEDFDLHLGIMSKIHGTFTFLGTGMYFPAKGRISESNSNKQIYLRTSVSYSVSSQGAAPN